MGDVLAEELDGLRAVKRVAVTEVQAMRAQDVGELTRGRADRWDHDRAAAHEELAAFHFVAARVNLAAARAEIGDALAVVEMNGTQAVVLRLFDVVPVGWNPLRVGLLGTDAEAADRC